VPSWPANVPDVAGTFVTVHCPFAISRIIGDTPVPNAIQVAMGENARMHCTNQKFSYSINWAGIPDAKLWTNCAATIASEEKFGIGFATIGTTGMNTKLIYSGVVVYEVEFRGAR